MIQSNLEASIKKVNRLIKDGEIQHPEVKKLIQNLIIYDWANDDYLSELELHLIELNYKLNMWNQIFPETYFVVSPDKIELHNVDIRKHGIRY